ncbi:MAG: ArnT family glycosyltransferase [Pyrinomonadaceae bacterium]
MNKTQTIWIILLIFAASFGIRFLAWENNRIAFAEPQWGLTAVYKMEAHWLVEGDFKLFLMGPDPPSDTTVIMHPPGYPIFIASVYSLFGDSDAATTVIQILLNSLSPVFIFLIALNLLDPRTAVIGGILAALSPQSACYAGVILPDGLSVVPILIALYAFIIGVKKERLAMAAVCGVLIGISCWLRSNALLLPVFFVLFGIFLLPKEMVVRFSLLLIMAFVLTIAPLTVRNWLVFHAFIPVSSAAGHNFIAGLADSDTDQRFGLPILDVDAARMEAERFGRPDYANSQYAPDGIPRERDRIQRGLKIVTENPGWYIKSVLSRGVNFMFRLERVPVIALERDERDTANPILYQLNRPLKALQRVFINATFLPFVVLGMFLLLWRKETRWQVMFLAIVPIYFFAVQSLLHTEYRYVLATPHIFVIFAGVPLSFLIGKVNKLFSSKDGNTSATIAGE